MNQNKHLLFTHEYFKYNQKNDGKSYGVFCETFSSLNDRVKNRIVDSVIIIVALSCREKFSFQCMHITRHRRYVKTCY